MGQNALRRAHAELLLSAVQNEYSMLWRGPENGLLDLRTEIGIGLIPISWLGYGLLTGIIDMGTSFAPVKSRWHGCWDRGHRSFLSPTRPKCRIR